MCKAKAGDLIFVKPNGWLFRLVRKVTKGNFGHVGLVAGMIDEHVLIVEAGRDGVDVNDLIWRTVRAEDYAIYRIDNITEKQRTLLVQKCMSYVGLPYDKQAWLNFIFKTTAFGSKRRMYCSEMIYRALTKLLIIRRIYHPEKISPADLFRLIEKHLIVVEPI